MRPDDSRFGKKSRLRISLYHPLSGCYTEVIRLKATGTGAKSRIMIFLSPLPDNKWIQSLRCYFSVNNVFTLTGYTGGDPANINVNGVEPGIETTSIYPVARTFTLGLSVQF